MIRRNDVEQVNPSLACTNIWATVLALTAGLESPNTLVELAVPKVVRHQNSRRSYFLSNKSHVTIRWP